MSYAIDLITKYFSIIGPERKEIISDIIHTYSNSVEPLDILGVGYALFYSGAKYRISAIEYFERFLNKPADISPYKMISLWGIYSDLAILYEKEYIYDKAIWYLEKCIKENNGSNPADYTRIGDILVKINLHDAENYYLSLLSDNTYDKFKYQFEYALNDVRGKIKRGYVYKPRPRKV